MPGAVRFTMPDGQKMEVPVKWSDAELEQMDKQQLLEVLREVRDFACDYDAKIRKPSYAAAEKLDRIESDIVNESNGKILMILAAVVAVVGLVLMVAGHSFLGTLALICGIGLMAIAGWALIQLKKHEKQYAAQKEKVDQLIKAGRDLQCTAAGANAFAVWPDEWSNPAAFQFAIGALENHRAQSLREVVELWEREKHNEAVRETLERQVQAQYETAQAARQAASAAQAAAGYSKVSAYSDIYDRDN